MSWLALLMLAQATAAPPPPAPPTPLMPHPQASPDRPLGPDVGVAVDDVGEEIVILARRLRLVHVHMLRVAHGKPGRCTIMKSSGDAEVDQLTCDAAVACSLILPDRDTPAEQMRECTRNEQARRVEELAQRRIEEEVAN